MEICFVSSPLKIGSQQTALLPSTRFALCTSSKKPSISTIRMASTQQREPWPARRFLKTAFWFSPLGRMLRPPPAVGTQAGRDRASSPDASRAAPPERSAMTVLVTGASGATGSRVVRELLADGSSVRALVRDREKAVAQLELVGVRVADYDTSRLNLIVSDLYNLPLDVFKNCSAVVSCTGTPVGPRGDTPDRARYLQGVKYYEPILLDDTPENVEYVGIKNLAEGAASWFQTLSSANSGRVTSTEGVVPILDLSTDAAVQATFGSLDDLVMGGVSQSSVAGKNGQLVFSGSISTSNSGGFASARTSNFPEPLDISECRGFRLRVKGDGQRYKWIARTDEKWDGNAHCYSFDTVAGEWIDVDMPFSSFNTVFRGDTLPSALPLDPSRIVAFQLMLSKFEYDRQLNPNFESGDFEIIVDSVSGYKDGAVSSTDTTPQYSKFVHLSVAGATQLFRREEFSEDQMTSAVKLNDMLGRITEWKFAGEDAIRVALRQHGYSIVRSCALTEKEPVGMESLSLTVGDNVKGQVSREDLARLLVESLYLPMHNSTFEVSEVREGEAGAEKERTASLEAFAGDLTPDTDSTTREFAAFPYKPL